MHVVNLATIRNKKYHQLRQVVLRLFDKEARIIGFHADIRSPKVSEMMQNEFAQLLTYEPKARVQLRFTAKAVLNYENDISFQN